MSSPRIEIVMTGDLVLDEPDAGYWLSGITPAMQAADLAIGHLEVPHSLCRAELEGDIPAPGAPPENVRAIAAAGIGMVSLAGNHIADCGTQGIADTIGELDAADILHAGAGADQTAARTPAIKTVNGRRIALLSYNCVGPEAAWATPSRAGCAYLPLQTADGSPVSPRANIVDVSPEALDMLRDDLAAARREADVVLVALHKGIVHVPAALAPYERPLARAAIELGADAVIGHHAHIARGVEFHRGRPIFHGLGNGCVVTRALAPDQDHPARREWALKRREMFGFEPDPDYHLAPFHPDARKALLGRISVSGDGAIRAGIIPVWVHAPGRPLLATADEADVISRYLEGITERAGMAPIRIDSDGWIAEAA